jgi:hypothetical protein
VSYTRVNYDDGEAAATASNWKRATRSESTRTRRQIRNGDAESLFVLVGAP